ncbi:MAG: hypothetical protein R3211_06440, partial [Balneolaceae bacterium]|nr:hypothetical protein [Balneolaceae bacterium]
IALLVSVSLMFIGCKQSLVISQVDYAQPIETVLQPDDNGMVHDVRQGIKFNVLPLQQAETGNSSSVTITEIRMIRGKEGFYYVTAPGFKNVYVMAPGKGRLSLENKIMISENGIGKPAFNQREPYILLLNRETNETYTLNANGIQQTGAKESDKTN